VSAVDYNASTGQLKAQMNCNIAFECCYRTCSG